MHESLDRIRFWWPWSHFQGHQRTFRNPACLQRVHFAICFYGFYILDIRFIYVSLDLITFWWPWLHFQGHWQTLCNLACLHHGLFAFCTKDFLFGYYGLYICLETWLGFDDLGYIVKVTSVQCLLWLAYTPLNLSYCFNKYWWLKTVHIAFCYW